MAEKIRLKTVLTKFNISLNRVVNFLKKNGITIDNNPNTKIGKKIYRHIVKEFNNYKRIKDESEKILLDNKIEKEKIKNITKKKKHPEHISTAYKKLDGVMLTGDTIDLSKFEKTKRNKKRIVQKNKRKRVKKQIFFKSSKRINKKNVKHHNIKNEKVEKQIKETLEKISSKGGKIRKIKKEKKQIKKEKNIKEKVVNTTKKILKVAEFTTVNELASMMNVNANDVIMSCMSLGIMVTMNQRLDSETITLVADEFKYDVEFVGLDLSLIIKEEKDLEKDLINRSPIVTIMGHVDHGKTSLLDYIRNTNVIAGEAGKITQHISAYNVKCMNEQSITFLDTPGHEAFTAMRARGAQVTDIVVIIIAADDQVMQQTKEAISHSQAADVPIIFAINKIDKNNSNSNRIKEQLAKLNFLVEEWGGRYPIQEISAKLGTGINKLLEIILKVANTLKLKANPKKQAIGTVIEASLDKGRGYISTIIVQGGTLQIGDYVLAGKHHGKIKNIFDERGNPIKSVIPAKPAKIVGLNGAPTAGDKFKVFKNEKNAKQIALKREQLQREQNIRSQKHLTLDEIGRRISLGDFKELKIILKGDVDGSVEAIAGSIQKLSTKNILIRIIYKGVGQITESDVLLATASNAIIIGFNVRPNISARNIAKKENIEIRTYSIIYNVIDDVKEAMKGMLYKEKKEKIIGNAEIREIFKIPKIGTIAGCMVIDGKLIRKYKIRLIRKGVVIHNNGVFTSLKRFKKDVKEVKKGYECGFGIKDYNNINIGDVVEVYEQI